MEAPGILNLIGGILTIIGGALFALVGSVVALVPLVSVFGALAAVFGLWGIIVGVLLILSAVKYEKEKGWATIGLIFSILGLVTLQGFLIGPILGIIGSALAISHRKKR